MKCIWVNDCDRQNLCCSACEKPQCADRCFDNPSECKYRANFNSNKRKCQSDIVFIKDNPARITQEIRSLLTNYQASNNLSNQQMLKLIGVSYLTYKKIMAEGSEISNETYSKLQTFLNKISHQNNN